MAGVAQRAARLANAKEQLTSVLVAQGFATPPTSKDKDIDTALLCEYAAECLVSDALPEPETVTTSSPSGSASAPKKRGRNKKATP